MKRIKKILSLIFILSLVFNELNAQDVKFIASLSKNPITQGERFQVTYTLHNAQGTRFRPPNFRGFTALMGPSTQQSTQIINGSMSQEISYTYVLQADKIGKYTLGPGTITVKGSQIKSNSLSIEVVEPSKAEQINRKQKQNQEKNLSAQAQNVIRKNLFVRTFVSKKNVYQGEQFVVTYKIYVHPDLNIKSLTAKKEPTFNGFWTQEINTGKSRWQPEIVNGVRFNAAIIKKVVLLPQRSGKLVIEPYSFDCVARLRVQGQRRQRRSMFDDFFGGGNFRDFPYVASSKKEFINVKSLPDNQPSDFNGAVGNMSFEAWLDKTNVKTGDAISLKVKISGNGNLKLIEPLAINFPPDFEVYDPKTADNVNVNASGISGNKIFEYIIIPKHAGNYKIKPIRFSYFDLKKKEFVSLSSKEFNISVAQGKVGQTEIISGVQKEDIKLLGKDIRFIKTGNINIYNSNNNLLGTTTFWILCLLPLILFLLIYFYRKNQQKLASNESLLRNKKATKVARKRLTTAKKFLSENKKEEFYEEISKALWGYISDKLSIPVSELTKDRASKSLVKKNVNLELINKCLLTIDNSEFARFAPSADSGEMGKIYNDSVSVITELEGAIK